MFLSNVVPNPSMHHALLDRDKADTRRAAQGFSGPAKKSAKSKSGSRLRNFVAAPP
jgi:hypothetical protein